MSDLFGHVVERPAFVDIRNQRESLAEEKARLCQELNSLLRKTPTAQAIGTVEKVRAYKYAHKGALKVLQSKASSRQELGTAISSIAAFHAKEPA
jgi:hypothetical protein